MMMILDCTLLELEQCAFLVMKPHQSLAGVVGGVRCACTGAFQISDQISTTGSPRVKKIVKTEGRDSPCNQSPKDMI